MWDRQERALEAWARAEGCWFNNVTGAIERRFGKEISHGAEAKVFHYDDIHVIKVISSPFDQQKTLDRITLTNFVFPFTGLRLAGLGRNEDGEFCFVVIQRFVIGEHVVPGLVSIDSLDDFKCLDDSMDNPEYATEHILLGDLHDRNVLLTPEGRPAVIDCNLFLNTPELKKGGKWKIPQIESDEAAIEKMDGLLDHLVPIELGRSWIENSFSNDGNKLSTMLKQYGFFPGSAELSNGNRYLVEVNPSDPDSVLLTSVRQARALLSQYPDMEDNVKDALAEGRVAEVNGVSVRFSPDKGRLVPVSQGRKEKVTARQADKVSLKMEKPHASPSLKF